MENIHAAVTDRNRKYSIRYFVRTTTFKALYRQASVKGGTSTTFVDAWISDASMKCVYGSALNASSDQ